ncbi:UBA domain-containing protein [Heracleum sosnowskyi]|uniref:UBA domain-containing protein n=1 Tax=Heracleum sosnowskyi TaxID=360622 RepID=A0AAD8JCG1_9APIA|nr:UBA domain-containing protein [Heracleum sosnowskyi]
MSPATKSKSKSKEKPLAKATKELQKASQKYPESNNGSTPASAYNPLSGTFHSLDTASGTSSPPLQSNGRFRNIEETDDHSEDHKEKVTSTAVRQDVVTVSDNEKREKIRQKNERKHQRQRERRAQELHERCSGYLMSRKLESLSQQIVAMGFTSERATMALMLNEGRLQESVNWLFEGTEQESQTKDIGSGANLKIDITEELARISEMEVRHKCSKQEVERVVVSCEGDLDKAEETLNSQKPEPITHPKPEESATLKHTMMHQEKPTSAVTTLLNRNESEMAYSKGAVALPTHPVAGTRNQLSSKVIPSKPQTEKRVPGNAYNSSLSYSSTAPIQVASSSAKVMSQLGVGMEGRSFQQGAAVKEPIVMMQRPQSINIKPSSVINSSASPPGTNQWYGNNVMGVDNMMLNGKLVHSQSSGNFGAGSQHFYPQAQSRNLGPDNPTSRQYNTQAQYMQQRAYMSNSIDPVAARPVASSWSTVGTSSSPSLTVPSSLGLFSGFGSGATTGAPSHVDWNARDMMSHCDYNSIDWTLKSSPLSPPKLNDLMLEDRSGGLMRGLSSMRGANGVRVAGLQDGVPTEATTSGVPREWTSPFAGKDIFSLPRQFVTSPSP